VCRREATAVVTVPRSEPSNHINTQEDPDRETGANESVPSCLHLRGKLNIGALEDALALVVQRHEVLHARYILRHGEVLQVSKADSASHAPLRSHA
jgi:hypothetical protein